MNRSFFMKSVVLVALPLLTLYCGGGSSDATAPADTDADSQDLAMAFSTALDVSALSSQETADEEDCTDEENNGSYIVTCTCPGGGTKTLSMDEYDLNSTGMTADYTITFNDCVAESLCAETTALSGSIGGTLTFEEDDSGEVILTSATAATPEDCAGLTVGDLSLGFSITMTYTDEIPDVDGTLCSDETSTSVSLESSDDLDALLSESECTVE